MYRLFERAAAWGEKASRWWLITARPRDRGGSSPNAVCSYMKANAGWLIDPASVRPSIKRGLSGPVRNTLFRGKLVNRLTLHHSLLLCCPGASSMVSKRDFQVSLFKECFFFCILFEIKLYNSALECRKLTTKLINYIYIFTACLHVCLVSTRVFTWFN